MKGSQMVGHKPQHFIWEIEGKVARDSRAVVVTCVVSCGSEELVSSKAVGSRRLTESFERKRSHPSKGGAVNPPT